MSSAPKGKVYLIGAGPGDPELISLRGVRKLKCADVVFYDALVHPDVLEHVREGVARIFVGKRAGETSHAQEDINMQMVAAAKAGHTVVRLKGGDPYLFGRGSEEAEFLFAHHIDFEVIPAVCSPLAAAAYAGIPLTHRLHASSVTYITATEAANKSESRLKWAQLATTTDTLVVLMGMHKLDHVMQTLINHGLCPDLPVAIVQWASLPKQRVVTGVASDIASVAHSAGLGAPSLAILGHVVSQRDALAWYEHLPLFGKRVLVTRPHLQSQGLCTLLRDAGAEPVVVPTIMIAPPPDLAPMQRAIGHLQRYDGVIFTSANGVAAFFDQLTALDKDSRALGSLSVVAIGAKTAAALALYGIKADLVPKDFVAESLVQSMLEHTNVAGKSYLLPRALVARDVIPAALLAAGAQVDVVPAYQTLAPQDALKDGLVEALQAKTLDVITFTSSSTVHHLVDWLGDSQARAVLADVLLAAIGPVTAQTLRDHGLQPGVVAQEYTTEGLVAALKAHYKR